MGAGALKTIFSTDTQYVILSPAPGALFQFPSAVRQSPHLLGCSHSHPLLVPCGKMEDLGKWHFLLFSLIFMFTELRASPLPLFWLHHFTALSNSAQLMIQQLLLSAAQTTPRTPGICPGLPTALASEFSVEWLPEISHRLRKQPHAHSASLRYQHKLGGKSRFPLNPSPPRWRVPGSIQPARGPGRPSWGQWFHC